ncbi:hypothetical protein Cgig2_030264 [Carnegiea gigantea]|uniref:Uncharacterized protein n=1 Tax=Carnegiea gigantea TaxID=171969 RepID=A0A9Q1K1B3_9CARY|nr:hypothetical protein Cgig2_030264 [Carnegiea gigantea]
MEAYITVDALKNFMTTMRDNLLQQVTEQVKKTVEVTSSIRALPRKALRELGDEEQTNRFLKRSQRAFRKGPTRSREEPWKEQCSTEIVATIDEGYAEGISHTMWKAYMRGTQQVAGALMQMIFIDTGSSADIITLDCLDKLKHPGREITPLAHPILGFGGQTMAQWA